MSRLLCASAAGPLRHPRIASLELTPGGVYVVRFRPLCAFFVIDVNRRELGHVGVTRAPNAVWTAEQLRQLRPAGEGPQLILRDRHDKFGAAFDRVAKGAGIRVLKAAVRAPLMTRRANDSSEASAASASLTSLSSARRTRGQRSWSGWRISIAPGHPRASTRGSRIQVASCRPPMVERSLVFCAARPHQDAMGGATRRIRKGASTVRTFWPGRALGGDGGIG